MLFGGKGSAFIFPENKKLWICSKLKMIRIGGEKPSENPGYKRKEINLK